MNLWIRSQDKKIMLKNPILIVDDDRILTPKNDYRDTHLILGHYKTKERALEVLDEIQKILTGRLIIKTNRKVGSKDLNKLANFFDTKYVINDNEFEFIQPEATNIIYEMPKE